MPINALHLSLVILPVYHLLLPLVLIHCLHSLVLRLHEPIPRCPIRVLVLECFVLIGVALVICQHFIQVCQSVNENSDFLWSFKEVLQSKLQAIFGFQQIYHLADRIFVVELSGSILHVPQSLILLLKIMLQFIAGYDPIAV